MLIYLNQKIFPNVFTNLDAKGQTCCAGQCDDFTRRIEAEKREYGGQNAEYPLFTSKSNVRVRNLGFNTKL